MKKLNYYNYFLKNNPTPKNTLYLTKLMLSDRVKKLAEAADYVTLKDHKENPRFKLGTIRRKGIT